MQLNILINGHGDIIVDEDINNLVNTVNTNSDYATEHIPIDTDLIVSDEYIEGSTELKLADSGATYSYYGDSQLGFCNRGIVEMFGSIPDSIYWKEA